jgi:hypothetical protein
MQTACPLLSYCRGVMAPHLATASPQLPTWKLSPTRPPASRSNRTLQVLGSVATTRPQQVHQKIPPPLTLGSVATTRPQQVHQKNFPLDMGFFTLAFLPHNLHSTAAGALPLATRSKPLKSCLKKRGVAIGT